MKKYMFLSFVLFFCTNVLLAQSITLQINNNTTNYTGTTLENALTSNSIALNSITHLTITAGDVVTADWTYLKAQKSNLTAMIHFTVTNGVATVASIPNSADYTSYFKEDTIQELSIAGVQSIGQYAFYGCTSFSTVNFPLATSIGNNAFKGCASLTTVSFPQATSIGSSAFQNCTNLTTASFPQATSMKGRVLWFCTSLTSLTLNATPPTVGTNPFLGTPATRSLTIVDNTGAPLTGTTLVSAVNTYDANESGASDYLWYGWQLKPTTEWTGATSGDWNTQSNWTNGIPNAVTNAIIPAVSQSPQLSTTFLNSKVANLTILPGGFLEIKTDLTIEGDLTQNDAIEINSTATLNGSLILKGQHLGNYRQVTYRRYLSDKWHLVASPVVGQSISGVTYSSDIAIKTNRYAIAPYNNSLATNRYEYYATATINSAGNFNEAQGYAIKLNNAGTVNFTGTLNTSDVTTAITDGSTTGNKWNLVGNPYTASIYLNSNANATNNFLTVNASELAPARTAVYLWNASTSSYDIINQTTAGSKWIAPGQGFFVEAKNGGGNIQFTEAMQGVQTGNIFLRNATATPSITVMVSNGTTEKTTDIKYYDNATTSLDVGYDAGTFTGENSAFGVFTKLIANDNTNNFAIQTLPTNNYDAMVIPVGVQADANSTLTFSANAMNLPSDLTVYLEDKQANTITKLDAQNTYNVTTTTALNGTGRFYIHTSAKALSIDKIDALKTVAIYKTENNSLRITGINMNTKSEVSVFNVVGKEVFTTNFTSKNDNVIQLPKVATGMYIVKLNTEQGNVSKKIIIE